MDRRGFIGSSDAAAILGLDKYRTPLDVFFEKTQEPAPDDDSEPAYWGRVLEGTVGEEAARRIGDVTVQPGDTYQHDDPLLSFLWAQVDRHLLHDATGEVSLLECKTAAGWLRDDWGESGQTVTSAEDPAVPPSYMVQVHHAMECAGTDHSYIAVLIGGQDFRWFLVQKDEEFTAKILVPQLRGFWENHVQKGAPPEPENAADLAALFPNAAGRAEADTELLAAHSRLIRVRRSIKKLEEHEGALKYALQKHMGEAAELVDATGRLLATWKTASRKGYTVEPKTYRTFRLKGEDDA
ncbi:MAG: YqaJ viral recombinase family protein [Rhodospirillaceae bacterium]